MGKELKHFAHKSDVSLFSSLSLRFSLMTVDIGDAVGGADK
jgi:hypothetical protein